MVIPKVQALRVKRIKEGLSMRALAAKAGIHYATLANIEKNGRGVNPRTAKVICSALQTPFDELFTIVD